MISKLRKEACPGSIHDLARIPTQNCLADCLTMASAKADHLITAQPCPVPQPEQQLLAQQEEETEWENVMKEIDVIFGESVEAPRAAQRDRAAARGKWRNMSAMPAPKRPVGQNPLECTLCHSVISESRHMRHPHAHLCCHAL